ncbi:winged helix-turn-helix domain-containing protein [Roseicyclus marinus]|uniref:winged helix-turn-helix domain-containing protein n=1 Tax=Roseicyclus marinus TaxID=2161673 RepID=UPI0024106458|nr:winged helix-turn-helix domain-containing protein [Roseicyclus marinus]MDG3040987.1 winged helix-turn-helix domain-containing protein [Roseicyclus marinus]
MLLETGDILHLAEPLKGVADVADPSVAAFLAGVGDRLAHLARCEGPEALVSAVAETRPDYVLMGSIPDPALFEHLCAAMRSATLGVIVLARGGAIPAALRDAIPARMGVDPLDPAEGLNGFTLHLRALMRRCRPVALTGRQRVGGMLLDEAALTLTGGAGQASLSLEDMRLIGPMFDVPGAVWSREALLRLAYGAQTENGLRTVDVKLNRARRRLRAALGQDPVRSVRGAGYVFDPGIG